MATLTNNQLVKLRQKAAEQFGLVAYNKSTINATLQAIEDFIEDNRATLGANIDTATSPFVFTNAQKKFMVAFYFVQKATRDGA